MGNEAKIQEAIQAYQLKKFKSIRAAAAAFSVPESTVRGRLAGLKPHKTAHEQTQILSVAEERILVRWITRLTKTGFPASPALLIGMAKEIRRSRFQLSASPPSLRRIGDHWVERFRTRHPEIQGI